MYIRFQHKATLFLQDALLLISTRCSPVSADLPL